MLFIPLENLNLVQRKAPITGPEIPPAQHRIKIDFAMLSLETVEAASVSAYFAGKDCGFAAVQIERFPAAFAIDNR